MKHKKRNTRTIFLSLLIIPMLMLTACGSSNNGGNAGGNGGDGTTSANSGNKKYTGTITFADAKWNSLEIHNWVARTILEKGYGMKTDVQTGSTAATLLGLKNNDIQAYMEIWELSVKDIYQKMLDSGKVKQVSVNYDDDAQGLYVPEYVIKGDPDRGIKAVAPGLKKVSQLSKYWKVFKDPKHPDKGKIIGAPASYNADKTLRQKMKAYGLNKTFNYVSPGSTPALITTLKTAYKAGKPWVGYGWTPTWWAAKFHLVLLQEPKFTEKCWDGNRKCAFPNDKVDVAVNSEFAKKAPKVVDFLSNYKTSSKITNNMLLYQNKNDASAQETAEWWLKNHDMWTKWVPEDVAKKVKSALK